MKMELKVSVDGVQRVVCGVTHKTTCQEVVIALAQALGRTGRYTLKERFKEFERSVSPEERLLESLAKYGQHSREVHLALLHNGPSLGGACAPLRRGDVGGRGQRRGSGSGSSASRRQSLPPLARLSLRGDPPQSAAEARKPKRKSLTLVEEAIGWLENLGRGGKPHRGRDRERDRGPEAEKRMGRSSDGSPATPKHCWSPAGVCRIGCQQRYAVSVRQQRRRVPAELGGGRGQDRDDNDNHAGETNNNGDAQREQGLNAVKAKAERKAEPQPARTVGVAPPPPPTLKMEERRLQALLIQQRARLHQLQLQLDSTDAQIQELEERQTARLRRDEEESEEEELAHWENELRAEEGYERDLQGQFREMKEKAAGCKAGLEEYKLRLRGLDLTGGRRALPEADPPEERGQESTSAAQEPVTPSWAKPQPSSLSTGAPREADLQQARPSTPSRAGEKGVTPTTASDRPHVRVSPQQTAEPEGRGVGQLRERWAHPSDSQKPSATGTTSPVVHRSEITIHLSSTRV